jgi:DNA polymerase-3 subunit alpha
MGKKKKEILDKEFEPFSAGMRERGYSDEAINTLWEILVPFSDYAFNKAHTAGYGLVSFWTAYLKANYPAEYMAALLTSVKDDKSENSKLSVYLNECRRMGIKVLPPDVNDSDADFTPRGADIRFGLSAIRNVGGNVVEQIVAARRSKGRFADFADFLRKVDVVVCNKRVIESLVKAGAFDSLGHTRRGLVAVHVEAVDAIVETKRAEAIGQFGLFDDGDTSDDSTSVGGLELQIPVGEWDKSVLLQAERDMLGLYVSDHPLMGVEHLLAQASDCSIAQLIDDRADGSIVTVGGLITTVQRKVTRNGDAWAIVTIEDLDGGVEVQVYPKSYQQLAVQLSEDRVVLMKLRVDRREDAPRFIGMDITVPDLAVDGPRGPVVVRLPASRCVPPVVDRLKQVLATHPGVTDVNLQLETVGSSKVLRVGDAYRVTPTPALFGDLKALLGPGCIA